MRRGTLFVNGVIRTLDPDQPVVDSLAVSAGRVVARGSAADLRGEFPGFDRVDLRGRVVLPGFTDSHIHLTSYGLSLRRVDLRDARSLREATAKVAAAARRAGPGEWIRGRGWDKNVWPEDRFPSAADLDRVIPDHPVALHSKDGHLLWVNTVALRLAGVDARTPDPPGGEIARDARGEPTGILKEEAKALVWRVMPPVGPDDLDAALAEATAAVHRFGLTGVHNFVGTDPAEGAAAFAAFQRLHARGALRLRVWMTFPAATLPAAIATGLRTGFGDDWLRVGPVKIFADGTLGSQTAAMLEPFEGQPGNTGMAICGPEELRALVGQATSGGFWCAVHAIGDRANRWVLDAYEAHHKTSARAGARHRIEHVQLLHPDDLPRLARLGVIASMQPIHATSDRDLADRYWGARARHGYAWRALRERGTVLAFGSDAPVETPDVFQGLYAAVTRKRPAEPDAPPWYPDQALTIEDALAAYTVGAAYASGEERRRGMLAEGYLADFIVLSRDPFAVPAEDLLATRVLATVVGGEVVFAGPEFSA